MADTLTGYVSLHTGVPATAGNEVSGNGYARVSATFVRGTVILGPGGFGYGGRLEDWFFLITHVAFPSPSPSAWGTVLAFGLWNAASGGTFINGGSLPYPLATRVGASVSWDLVQLWEYFWDGVSITAQTPDISFGIYDPRHVSPDRVAVVLTGADDIKCWQRWNALLTIWFPTGYAAALVAAGRAHY
jgi:hypothetical protein